MIEAGRGDQEGLSSSKAILPPAALVPGLFIALLLDGLSILGIVQPGGWINSIIPVLYGLIPLLVLVLWKRSVQSLGIIRKKALTNFGWGWVWGAFWRAGSLIFNAIYGGQYLLSSLNANLLFVILIIPWLEEIFFRGYLGRGLCVSIGRWPGILVQAVIFTLLPAHWSQGLPHVAGIFLFGVMAGWLVERHGSIWHAMGAHSFANALPTILVLLTQTVF